MYPNTNVISHNYKYLSWVLCQGNKNDSVGVGTLTCPTELTQRLLLSLED